MAWWVIQAGMWGLRAGVHVAGDKINEAGVGP
jgi:hypothetical protein